MNRTLALALGLVIAPFSHVFGASIGTTIGPSRGTLVIVGGGTVGSDISDKFFELAGGKDAPIIVIPTADAADEFDASYLDKTFLRKAGATNLILLHTRSRAVADTKEFAAPIKKARAIWFVGGRQWRLVDSYLNTRTETEMFNLLKRGGVIGGSSAGATIQGSYLVRGAREGNTVMMAKGYETGMGFLKNSAIDQHIITRHREADLDPVMTAHPELLGIGIDESTAIVVQGARFNVIGKSKVAIHEAGKPFFFLQNGDAFDLRSRRKLE